jgi:hypothetical protein
VRDPPSPRSRPQTVPPPTDLFSTRRVRPVALTSSSLYPYSPATAKTAVAAGPVIRIIRTLYGFATLQKKESPPVKSRASPRTPPRTVAPCRKKPVLREKTGFGGSGTEQGKSRRPRGSPGLNPR